MRKPKFKQILRAVNNYLVFFLIVAFVVSCCMMLFVTVLADTMGLVFTKDNIAAAAKLTFGNVLLITFLSGTIDYTRRKQMVERPVKQIMAALDQVMQGDFSVRIAPVKEFAGETGFNEIIKAINKMTAELAGTETLRTDFIANVSHELKTPLAVMGNYATMLQKPGISEEDRIEYAKAISHSSRRLAALITNILKLNKLENQKIFPQLELPFTQTPTVSGVPAISTGVFIRRNPYSEIRAGQSPSGTSLTSMQSPLRSSFTVLTVNLPGRRRNLLSPAGRSRLSSPVTSVQISALSMGAATVARAGSPGSLAKVRCISTCTDSIFLSATI